jgi:phage tail-like protein
MSIRPQTAPADLNERAEENSEGISRRWLLNGAGVLGGAVLAAAILPAAAAAEPLAQSVMATRFSLSADAIEIASFHELVGMVVDIQPVEFVDSTTPGQVVHTAQFGKTVTPQVTLMRGLTGGLELWAWYQLAANGDPSARRTCTLTMLNASGAPVAKFTLQEVWVSKLDIASPKAGSSGGPMEIVTLVCNKLVRVPLG